MRKKKILFHIVLAFFLINFIFTAVNAVAVDYTLDIKENDTLIWAVDELDEEKYQEVLLEIPGFKEDDQKKYEIQEIEKSTDYWKVSFYEWEYTDNSDDFSDDADKEKRYNVYRDPEENAEDILLFEEIIGMWVIPTPYTNYLEEFRDNFNHPIINIKIDGDALVVNWGGDAAIPSKYEVELTYETNGVMKTFEYFDQNGDTFFKLTLLQETIPSYNIFIIMGILLFSALIGIVIFRKKLLITKN